MFSSSSRFRAGKQKLEGENVSSSVRLSLCVSLRKDIIDNSQSSGNKNANPSRQEKRRKYTWLRIEKLRKMQISLIKTSAQMTRLSTNSFQAIWDMFRGLMKYLSSVECRWGFWWMTARTNHAKRNGKSYLRWQKVGRERLQLTLDNRTSSRRPFTYTRNLLNLKCIPKLRTWQENVYLLKGCIEYKYLSPGTYPTSQTGLGITRNSLLGFKT